MLLDANTVPVEDYLDDNGLVLAEHSDIQNEEAVTRAEGVAESHFNCKVFEIETGTKSNETLQEKSSWFGGHSLTLLSYHSYISNNHSHTGIWSVRGQAVE